MLIAVRNAAINSISDVPLVNGSIAGILVAVVANGLVEGEIAIDALVLVSGPLEGVLSSISLGSSVCSNPVRLVLAHQTDTVIRSFSGLAEIVASVLQRVFEMRSRELPSALDANSI